MALDTCPLRQHSLASIGTQTEEIRITICECPGTAVVWKSLTDLGQREGKQQQNAGRQEQTMAMQRPHVGKG